MTALSSHSVLVLAPRGRDAGLATQLLARAGLQAIQCGDVDEIVSAMPDAGCAVITAETLTSTARGALVAALAQQPPWSDFPIILFTPRTTERTEEVLAAINMLGNVTILERPVHSGTLVSAVVAALRGRARQYEARDAIVRRDEFLAMLGHELRNPLASIMLALETMPNKDADPGARQRAVIERQVHHLARLVDDLLDVARVTSGKVHLQLAPVDLGEVVARCVHAAEPVARTRSIELHHTGTDVPMMIDGDLVRLEEIFNNLITNALKYSPEHARVEVRTFADGGHFGVEVADTGIGIAPDMLPRVFELFEQAKPSLDRRQGGLGVGLTLVRSLVELHGGSVRADSAGLGHGSRFTVRFVRRDPVTTVAAVDGGTDALQLRIVVVDDNSDLLEMTKDLLELRGCVVDTANDGPSGLAKVVEAAPDLALIDIGLPGLSGYEVAERLRGLSVDSCLVAMTGYGQPDDQARAIAAGFDMHLTKPVTWASLSRAISTCMVRHKPIT